MAGGHSNGWGVASLLILPVALQGTAPGAVFATAVALHLPLVQQLRVGWGLPVGVAVLGGGVAVWSGTGIPWAMGGGAALIAASFLPSPEGLVRSLLALIVLACISVLLLGVHGLAWTALAAPAAFLLSLALAGSHRPVATLAAVTVAAIALTAQRIIPETGALAALFVLTMLAMQPAPVLWLGAGLALAVLLPGVTDPLRDPVLLAAFVLLVPVLLRQMARPRHRMERAFTDDRIGQLLSGRLLLLRLDMARQVAVPVHDPLQVIPYTRLFGATGMAGMFDLLDPTRTGEWQSVRLAPFGETGRWQARVLVTRRHRLMAAISAEAEDALLQRAEAAENRWIGQQLQLDQTLAMASHVLRTPVSAVDMLLEDLAGGTPPEDVLPQLTAAMAGLKGALDDLAQASGDPAGLPVRDVFNPRDVTDELTGRHESAARAVGMKLVMELSGAGETPVAGDYGRVLMALSRLMDNAIRHSGSTHLVLRCFHEPGAILWHLSDNGRGIPPDRLETLFTPFVAGGIGLYAARALARMAGGALTIEPSDKGTTFVLHHPVRPVPQGVAP